MKATQEAHMQDTCVIVTLIAGTKNEFNEDDSPTEQVSEPTPCGLDMKSGSERPGTSMTPIQYDATLRLPLRVKVNEKNLIRILSRFGQPIAPLTYSVASPI